MSNDYVKIYTSADVKPEALKDKGLVLVDFWAPWCGPCRMVGPIVEQLAQEYDGKVTVAKLNVDDEGAGAMDYAVNSIPTMILFKDGQIADRIVGARGKPALMEMIDKHIVR